MRTNVVLGLQVLRRASAFLAEEKDLPAKMGSIPKHVEALNGVIARVETFATEQEASDRSYLTASLAAREASKTLVREHVRPVVIMGELLFPVGSPVRAGLKRPGSDAGYEELMTAAEGIATLVEEHKAVFIEAGFVEDFIERLRGGIAALRKAIAEKADHLGRRSAATAGLVQTFARARKMMRLLHTMVAPQLRDADRVAQWKTLSHFVRPAKRNGEEVQGETPSTPVIPGGTSTPEGTIAA